MQPMGGKLKLTTIARTGIFIKSSSRRSWSQNSTADQTKKRALCQSSAVNENSSTNDIADFRIYFFLASMFLHAAKNCNEAIDTFFFYGLYPRLCTGTSNPRFFVVLSTRWVTWGKLRFFCGQSTGVLQSYLEIQLRWWNQALSWLSITTSLVVFNVIWFDSAHSMRTRSLTFNKH